MATMEECLAGDSGGVPDNNNAAMMGAFIAAGSGVGGGSEDFFDDTNVFENKSGLAEDMRFLASMPELCDVTFLVGDTREPVCGVKAVLAARSRYAFRGESRHLS